MNKIFKIGVIGLFSLFLSCDKNGEISKSIKDDVFSGVYTRTYKVLTDEETMTMSWVSYERQFTLDLKNGTYTCEGDDEGHPSFYGAGTFSVEKDIIIFNDEVARNAQYSWEWILGGEYNFTFDGKRLQFSKNNDYSRHEYILEKQ